MNIQGRRVLITGASRGLGRTLAFSFYGAGAREVVAGTRNQVDRDSLMSNAAELNVNIIPVQLDVRVESEIAAVAGTDTFDILVNNAGVAGFGNPVDMDFAKLREELEVNYVGPPIGDEAKGLLAQLATDAVGLEKMLSRMK